MISFFNHFSAIKSNKSYFYTSMPQKINLTKYIHRKKGAEFEKSSFSRNRTQQIKKKNIKTTFFITLGRDLQTHWKNRKKIKIIINTKNE